MLFHRHMFLIPMFAAPVFAVFVIACGGESAPPTAAAPVATAAPAAAVAATPESQVVPTDTAAPAPTATTAPAPTAPATTAPAPTTPAASAPAPTEAMAATAAPTEPAPEPATPEAIPSSGSAVFQLSEGTIARYKVEEVLANTGFKIATGETMDVAGSIAFDADGAVIAEESRIAVQSATLMTDSARRDGYVRSRTLETDTYPEVVFVPTSIDGLPESITEASGHAHVHITGDLTVKDQTREVTWDGEIDFPGDGTASGTAAVTFTFDDFGMTKPSVVIVLSVEDEILLELDFVGAITGQ